MQRFMRGRAIHPGVVAGSTASFVDGPSVLRGNTKSHAEQECDRGHSRAQHAGHSAGEGKCHIGMDFIMLTAANVETLAAPPNDPKPAT